MKDSLTVRSSFRDGLLTSMREREMFNEDTHTEEAFLSSITDPSAYSTGAFTWSLSPYAVLSLHHSNGLVNNAVFSVLPKSRLAI